MRFTVPAGDLAAALDLVALVRDDKSNVAALSMAHIHADGEQIEFVADCLDCRIAVTIAAKIEETGEACARAGGLAELTARLPANSEVSVRGDGDDVIISAGRSRFKLRGLPLDQLPQSAALADTAPVVELDFEDFERLLTATAFAISTMETHYYLNGIYLHPVGKMLRAVATDGHRLAQYEVPAADGLPGIIVPRRTVEPLIKLFKKTKSTPQSITLRSDGQLLELAIPGMVLTSKLIDGTFPDYQRIMPKPAANVVTVDREGMAKALARLAAVADQKAKTHAVGFSWSDDTTELHLCLAAEPDIADDALPAEVEGAGRVACNIGYLSDVLKTLHGKIVHIANGSPMEPIIITDPDDSDLKALVMPIAWRTAT